MDILTFSRFSVSADRDAVLHEKIPPAEGRGLYVKSAEGLYLLVPPPIFTHAGSNGLVYVRVDRLTLRRSVFFDLRFSSQRDEQRHMIVRVSFIPPFICLLLCF